MRTEKFWEERNCSSKLLLSTFFAERSRSAPARVDLCSLMLHRKHILVVEVSCGSFALRIRGLTIAVQRKRTRLLS